MVADGSRLWRDIFPSGHQSELETDTINFENAKWINNVRRSGMPLIMEIVKES
ncbi:hypothetical protein OCU04_004160 [Sclerotinia nivalis]|uniref:Uncharacterized protein n=1 Tax=Sclerotinia nivalis TaxID=352851 RepID=A0A9X0APW4_9HELO|nr:hypothetical protein OCU04_004160 [Sclerotinia nivalis]